MPNKFRFLCIAALVVVMGTVAVAQVAGDYRSLVTGNWSIPASWETYNGSAWIPASTAPGVTANVTVLLGDTITLDVAATAATVTIADSGQLTIGAGTTLNGNVTIHGAFAGAGAVISMDGNITCSGPNATLRFTSSSGKITGVSGKVFTLSNGATLQSAQNGVDPLAVTMTNLTWVINNSPALTTIYLKNNNTATLFPPPNGQTIGNLIFTTASGNSNKTFTFGADVSVLGDVSWDYVTTGALANTWDLAGFKISTSGVGKSVTVAQVPASPGLIIKGTGSDLFTGFATYNFLPPANAKCYVNYASTTGTQNVVGGSYHRLTISGGGAKTLSGNATVNDTLTLSSGIISTGVNTLTALGAVSEASGTSYVQGKLARVYTGTGAQTFPIGAASNYRPLTLNYTALTGTSTVTVEQTEGAMSGTLPPNTTLFAARYWTVTQTGGSAFTYDITLDGSGFTPSATPVILKKDGSTITSHIAIATPPTYSGTGLTSLSGFALGDFSPPGPTITVIASLSPFLTFAGTPSAEQSYLVSGASLTGNITITPPADFELSLTSGSGFSTSPIILTQSGGTVGATTIYVRLNRATAGTPSGNITHTSPGATQQNLPVSGTVNAFPPSITVTGSLTPFTSAGGVPSAEQTYTVAGSNLLGNILVTAPTDFQVSTTGGGVGFGSSVTLVQSGGVVGSTTIYVRMYRATPGTPSGNITHSSTGGTTQNLAVSGTVTPGPTITSTTTGGPWSTTTTWVGGIVPGAGNAVIIADGATVTINTDATVPSLTVGQGSSGVLTFDGTAIRSLTVTGNVLVSAGGTLTTQASGNVINQMYIGGNLINNGTFDMNQSSSTRNTGVTFTRTDGDQTISGAGSTTVFRGITLNKGSVSNKVIASINVSNGPSSSLFVFVNGTWEQTAGALTITGGTQTIGVNGALVISANGSYNQLANDLTVNGTITVNTTGTVVFGTGSSQVQVRGTGSVGNFTAGTVNINGRFAATDEATMTVNGALINLDPLGNTGTQNAFAINTGVGVGTAFTFTSGTITILNPITAPYTGIAGGREFQITSSGVVNISGTATVVLGQGAGTLSGPNGFRINCSSANALQNLTINTGTNTVKSAASNVTVKGTLTLTSGIDSIGAQVLDGVAANQATSLGLSNPVAGTVSNLKPAFHSVTGTPLSSIRILGTAPAVNIPSQFGRLSELAIDNPNGTTLQANLIVDTALTLTNGALNLNSRTLTYGTPGRLLYNGLSAQTTANAEFPLSGGPHRLVIQNAAGVALHASRTLDSSLTVTTGNLNLNGNTVTLGPSALLIETPGNTVTGTSGVITTTRVLTAPAGADIGGLGVAIASSANLGSTVITRGHAQQSGGFFGIRRYFDITPTVNTGLNANLSLRYDGSELGGIPEGSLALFKSTNGGSSWSSQGGILDTGANTLTLAGIDGLSRWTIGAPPVIVGVPYAGGWNMISNPVFVTNDSVRQLFPLASFSYAFRFSSSSGYVQSGRLEEGIGYWEKFLTGGTASISGAARQLDTLSVSQGWNMIGSISSPVDTANVIEVPAGLIATAYFGFSSGYTPAATLVPGKGYWVKASQAGQLILSSAVARSSHGPANHLVGFSVLTIADAAGASQKLYIGEDGAGVVPVSRYDMPPRGPAGVFDARFESDRMLEVLTPGGTARSEYPVTITGARYPLTVHWNIPGNTGRNLTLMVGDGGSVNLQGVGTTTIANPSVNRLVIAADDAPLPLEFALDQNYPNPFNPTTSIRFGLPVDSRVAVEIYNMLGQKVRTLLSEDKPAGFHVAEWNGTGNQGQPLGSGAYFLRLSAMGKNGVSFSEVRKLMMLK